MKRQFDLDAELQADEPVEMKIAGFWFSFVGDPPARAMLEFLGDRTSGYASCLELVRSSIDSSVSMKAKTPDGKPRGDLARFDELMATNQIRAHQITSMNRSKPGAFNHLWAIYIGGDEAADPTGESSPGAPSTGATSPAGGLSLVAAEGS